MINSQPTAAVKLSYYARLAIIHDTAKMVRQDQRRAEWAGDLAEVEYCEDELARLEADAAELEAEHKASEAARERHEDGPEPTREERELATIAWADSLGL